MFTSRLTRDRVVHHRGVSLVEVMASLLLIGTMITAMLAAQAGSLRMISIANQGMVAAELTRELITGWQLDGANVVAAASGSFAGSERWTWSRTSRVIVIQEQIRMYEVTVRTEHAPPDGSSGGSAYDFVWLVNESRDEG